MSSTLQVSVCMITYNHEDFIQQAIEGVLMQECDFNVELIIADDCSPDSTNKIVHSIIENHPRGSLIKYIRHEKNVGMMPNFVFAMQQCKGEYIALCEGDDYWTDPLKLQKQVDFLEANPDYVLCFHQVNILKTNGEIVDDFITKVPENHEAIETLARLGNYIHTPSLVYRNVIEIFPAEFTLAPIGDYFLYMLLSEHGKLHYIDEKMAVYREGVGIWSTKTTYYRNLNTTIILAILVNIYIKKKNDLIVKIFLTRIQDFLERFDSHLVAADLCKLNSHMLVSELIYGWFLKKNNVINNEGVGQKRSKDLLKIIFFRFRKRIWKI